MKLIRLFVSTYTFYTINSGEPYFGKTATQQVSDGFQHFFAAIVGGNYGKQNNIVGKVYENVKDSQMRRQGEKPFFQHPGAEGFDRASLSHNGDVILHEMKFQNRVQYDDFTAITENLNTNIDMVLDSLSHSPSLTKAEKQHIVQTLESFKNGIIPENLKIVVHSGKKAPGKRLQNRVRQNTQEIPVEFYNDRS